MKRLVLQSLVAAGLLLGLGTMASTGCVAPPGKGDTAGNVQNGKFVTVDDVDDSFNSKITGERYRISYEQGDLWKGAPDGALVTIVEYSDFQCPYCKRLADTLDQVAEAYPQDVRIVFKHFPLPMHKDARPASEAVLAAHAQGKGWEMHDKVFQNARALSREDLIKYGQEIGVPDMDKFKADLESGAYAAKVDADMAGGKQFAVRSTPSFFVNGVPQRGAMNFERLKSLIEEEKKFAQGLLDAGVKREELYARIIRAGKTERAAPPQPERKPQQRPGQPDPAVNYAVPTDDRPQKGKNEALVTIVEWSDFQCPFCRRVLPTMEQIEKEYGDKVRIVFRQQPLPNHPLALPAAKATLAAHKQGKFWELHDKLFDLASKNELTEQSIETAASELQLDMTKFKADMESEEIKTMIAEDQQIAAKFGANGTPNFFVNGRNVPGALPFEEFKKLIDEELAKAEKFAKEHPDVAADQLYNEMIKGFETEIKVPPVADHQRRELDVSKLAGKGNLKDPKITIVECSDFDCPFCKRGADLIGEIFAAPEYKDLVAFYFVNLPLQMHPKAEPAHRAAIAAGKQGKFFEMHDLLFADKAKREEADFKDMASQLSLDVDKFLADWNSEETKQQIADEKAFCGKYGVSGTPAFFINGRLMRGAQPFSEVKKVLDEELAGGFEAAKAKAEAEAKPADGKAEKAEKDDKAEKAEKADDKGGEKKPKAEKADKPAKEG